jgi:hypothetical protein
MQRSTSLSGLEFNAFDPATQDDLPRKFSELHQPARRPGEFSERARLVPGAPIKNRATVEP